MIRVAERLQELVGEIKKGNLSCFDELYETTKRVIFFNIFSYVQHQQDAEDLLQETYVSFLKSIEEVKASDSIMGYLMTISKNVTLNHLKKKARYRNLSEAEESTISSKDHYGIEGNELVNRMKEILKPNEFRIVYLKVVEEYSHHEIANLLGKPLGTITWAYNNAMKKLKKGLEKDYGK